MVIESPPVESKRDRVAGPAERPDTVSGPHADGAGGMERMPSGSSSMPIAGNGIRVAAPLAEAVRPGGDPSESLAARDFESVAASGRASRASAPSAALAA